MARGLDCHSNLHFISILFRSKGILNHLPMSWDGGQLLICRFNGSGLVDACFFNALKKHSKFLPGIKEVQELLFREETASLGGVKMWKIKTKMQKASDFCLFVSCCAVLFAFIWWTTKCILDSVML